VPVADNKAHRTLYGQMYKTESMTWLVKSVQNLALLEILKSVKIWNKLFTTVMPSNT